MALSEPEAAADFAQPPASEFLHSSACEISSINQPPLLQFFSASISTAAACFSCWFQLLQLLQHLSPLTAASISDSACAAASPLSKLLPSIPDFCSKFPTAAAHHCGFSYLEGVYLYKKINSISPLTPRNDTVTARPSTRPVLSVTTPKSSSPLRTPSRTI
ncbi:hypothetical protein M9H77_09530 [Catharanthus roseus]|uniref:Uncharacterized protein n=1 Tax=Catharanthus roseus TaxID=4058 RepID=A0ACC0C105_CATRO|nr:hypothetical protein M9H77_09530 [Catharanthus roseus]